MGLCKRVWRKIFFSSVSPVIELGARRSLEPSDLPDLPMDLNVEVSTARESAFIDWASGPRLLKSILFSNKRQWFKPLGFYLTSAALNLSGPVFVNLFIKRLQHGLDTRQALTEALMYGFAIGTTGIFSGLCMQHYFFHNLRRNQTIVNLINTRLFRHALNMSKEARERIPVGDIVNHMSTDTDAVAEIAAAFSDLIYCSAMIFGALGLLFHYIGSTAWVAVGLLTVLAPLTKKVSREFTRFDEDLMRHRDRRVSLMSQILMAIRLVKYFVWEESMGAEVERIREQELTARRRIARAELFVTLLYVSVGTFVLFAVFSVHAWRGGSFDPALVFTCVSLFSLLEDPFAFMSKVISTLINAKVGGERVTRFLAQPTAPAINGADENDSTPVGFEMRGLSVHLGEARHPSLLDLNLKLNPGESLAVVGPVGAGKSTFIHALLGEVDYSSGELDFLGENGSVRANCRIGYVPQEAYILNGTLRENLTFGNEGITAEDVERAVRIAGLEQDLRAMPAGLNTEIGEKGINLSGGQRQRLSLARAILHKPQLIVLDDPLSAVDPAMEDHLARELLFGEWKHVTKVAITHRLGHLERFDKIAFLEAGRLIALGTFAELTRTSAVFRAYMHEYAHAHAVGALEPKAEAARAATATESSRITEDEDRAFGAVRGGVYGDYVLSLAGEKWRPLMLGLLAAAAASGTVFPLIQKGWLAYFSNHSEINPLTAIYIYGAFGMLVMAGALCSDLFWLNRGLAAGRSLHEKMLGSVLGASVRFFDATPIGRVLQRFSRDMEAIDIQLQWSFENSMKCFAQVLITLALIFVALPWVIAFVVPVLAVYYRVQKLYRASAREVKRLDSIGRSPRYAHFKETLQGLVVIRAYGKREWFLREFYKRLNHSQRMFYGHYMINRWFSSRIPLIGGLVSLVTVAGISFSVRSGGLSTGSAGLLTIYSLSFWGVLNWGIRIWAEVEARMTSMERVKFYSRLPQEVPVRTPGPIAEPWPAAGEVVFENVTLRYAEHLPLVLNGLSFRVKAGSRVGIVGRTGSGKSTLFQALYRFTELESGRILIDGTDIASVPLARLRKSLAIIPQDPTLFMGTIRDNLDRNGEYSDDEVWSVLDRTSLGGFVRALPGGLRSVLNENGSNLSQGQRQLMCLARALLIRAKVIILDEATASVDVKTDAQVQRVLRESCQGITMLIIAHRLGTVRDCDQILEIAEGRLRRRIEPHAEGLFVPAPVSIREDFVPAVGK